MQITVAPASAQTCRAAVQALLNDPSSPTVVGIYRNLSKVPEEFKSSPNFKAVQGDLTDAATLDLAGSDAVLTMSPPLYDGSDTIAYAKNVMGNVCEAVKKAGSVKRLVYISSMGAQYAQGVGEIRTNHECEQILKGVAPEVVFIRNGYFMENWGAAIETIMTDSPFFYSPVNPINFKMPMVSTQDIGKACAGQLLAKESELKGNPYIFDLHGPQDYSTEDVKAAFEAVTGKSIEVKLVEKDQLPDLFAQILPPTLVSSFVEMTLSFLPGGVQEVDMRKLENAKRGTDTLVDAFTRMLEAAPPPA